MDEVRNDIFWKALDNLVERKKTTRSMLAVKCGLDSTSLNPSKTKNGRWVSLGVFFRLCDGLNIPIYEFMKEMEIIAIKQIKILKKGK